MCRIKRLFVPLHKDFPKLQSCVRPKITYKCRKRRNRAPNEAISYKKGWEYENIRHRDVHN